MRKIYFGLIAVVITAIVVIVAVNLGGCDKKEEIVPAVTPRPSSEVVVKEVAKIVEVEKHIDSEIIEDGLRDMGVLITEEYYFTEVVNYTSIKKFFKLFPSETSFLASYDGEVTAGIDFSGARVEKDDEAKRVTVHIPKAEVQNVHIDFDSFQLYSEKTGIGNPLHAEDFNQSFVELENNAREKAISRGLLESADKNAELVISNFIGSLIDLSEYTLTFEN